jgi:pimeloyl-ACP methyl ester carboxylesterase
LNPVPPSDDSRGAAGAVDLRDDRVESAGGVTLHVTRAGPPHRPAVVLLHGFPEDARTWRRQIPPLVRAGFQVLAPDLRGYHRSDRPRERAAYHLRHLVADVAAVVRASGQARAHVVGHDWGGIIAWTFAGQYPALLDRLVILNAPHMAVYTEKVWRTSQLLRSWYVGFFQLPWLPERAVAAWNYRALRRALERTPARPGAYSPEEIEAYVAAMSQPGALKAAIDYYRENMRSDALELARSARTSAPTLVVWGERDPALSVQLLDGLERFAPNLRLHRIADAGHWVHREATDEVNRELLSFLTPQDNASHE